MFLVSLEANKFGDHLGKPGFRVGEANIGHIWQSGKDPILYFLSLKKYKAYITDSDPPIDTTLT